MFEKHTKRWPNTKNAFFYMCKNTCVKFGVQILSIGHTIVCFTLYLNFLSINICFESRRIWKGLVKFLLTQIILNNRRLLKGVVHLLLLAAELLYLKDFFHTRFRQIFWKIFWIFPMDFIDAIMKCKCQTYKILSFGISHLSVST